MKRLIGWNITIVGWNMLKWKLGITEEMDGRCSHVMLGFQVMLVVENLPMQEMQEGQIPSLGQEDPLEKEVANHSSNLAWRITWTEESGVRLSVGSQRVKHDWSDLVHTMLVNERPVGSYLNDFKSLDVSKYIFRFKYTAGWQGHKMLRSKPVNDEAN